MNKLPARIICCSFISIVLLSACTVNNQKPADSIVTGAIGKKLDTLLTPHIQRIIKSYDLPGLAIGVVKDEGIIYAKAFGYLSIETKEPVKLTSLFHMASISKPFVATAIMQLVEENRINLDSTVVSYLPYFQLDDERYREITIRQMLNHISGMTDVQDYEWDKPVYSQEALERYVRSISSEKMRDAPGKSFAYSNMAFECLGDVIAKVSGLPFADYVKENILDPSGIPSSYFPVRKPDASGL